MRQYGRVDLGRDSSGRPLVVDARTKTMLDIAAENAGVAGRVVIVQGSYRAGNGASASAGTHDGGGVVDLRTWNLTEQERDALLWQLRVVGFAAWYRHEGQGFDPHIHAVDIGNRRLDPSAAAQVSEYKAGRNGLASRGADDFRRPKRIRPFNYRLHVERERLTLLAERLRAARGRLSTKTARFRVTRAIKRLRGVK